MDQLDVTDINRISHLMDKDQLDVTDIYRIFHLTDKEYFFFTSRENLFQNQTYHRTQIQVSTNTKENRKKQERDNPLYPIRTQWNKLEINKRNHKNIWRLNNTF